MKEDLQKIIKDGIGALRKADDPAKALAALEELRAKIPNPFSILKRKTLAEHVQDKIARMEDGEPDRDVVKTWIRLLDKISPMKRGDMPIISGRPKLGKSALAQTILTNICLSSKLPGVIYSLESPASEIIDRIFAGVSRIPMSEHHVKKLGEDGIKKSMEAARKIAEANIIIHDDIYGLSGIVSSFRQMFLDLPDIILGCLDYAQLCDADMATSEGRTREGEVAAISRTIRLLALETKVPWLLLSQENEQGDTRESKSLIQDCTAWWQIGLVDNNILSNERVIRIPRQRNGPSGESVKVTFLGNIARIENFVAEEI